MSHMSSPIDKIKNLNFSSIKGNYLYKGCSVVITDGGVVIKTQKGKFLTNILPSNSSCGLGIYRWTRSILTAFRKLGVVTKEEVDVHIKACQDRDRRHKEKMEICEFVRLANKYQYKIEKFDSLKCGDPIDESSWVASEANYDPQTDWVYVHVSSADGFRTVYHIGVTCRGIREQTQVRSEWHMLIKRINSFEKVKNKVESILREKYYKSNGYYQLSVSEWNELFQETYRI